MSELRLSIEHWTTQNMGDHGREVTIPHESIPGETVEALAARVFRADRSGSGDFIAIRLVVPAFTSNDPWAQPPCALAPRPSAHAEQEGEDS